MCIIAIKSKHNKFMSKATLEECFRNNPDGAGFMYPANGEVHIRKGYMSFNSFWKALKKVREEYGDDIPYVMHFRISTQAGVQPSCTHPFPLSKNMDDLRMLSCKSKIGIAHNGIIQLTTDHSQKTYSDTMKFITDYVPFFIKNLSWWKSEPAKKSLEKLCGSKLAILGGDGHIERIGDFVKDEGNYYSNTTYKVPKYNFNTGFNEKWWGSLYDNINYDAPIVSDDYSADDWEMYWNEAFQTYDFDESWCPMACDDCELYCEHCSNKYKCSTYSKLVDTTETLKVSEPKKKKSKK